MYTKRLRVLAVAAAILLLTALFALAQAPAAPATGPAANIQFPQLPLKRDTPADTSALESLGWAALLIAALAGAGLLVVRQKSRLTLGGSTWLRPAPHPAATKTLSSIALTQHASLHVIEWNGEQLLLGCTTTAVTLLARRPGDAVQSVAHASAGAKDCQ